VADVMVIAAIIFVTLGRYLNVRNFRGSQRWGIP